MQCYERIAICKLFYCILIFIVRLSLTRKERGSRRRKKLRTSHKRAKNAISSGRCAINKANISNAKKNVYNKKRHSNECEQWSNVITIIIIVQWNCSSVCNGYALLFSNFLFLASLLMFWLWLPFVFCCGFCRKIWSRVYGNPQIKDQYTAFLGIPEASRLDEGVYTCQVSHNQLLRFQSIFDSISRLFFEPSALQLNWRCFHHFQILQFFCIHSSISLIL